MRYSCKASVEYDLKNHYQLRDLYTEELAARSEYAGCQLKRKASRGIEYYYVRPSDQDEFDYRGAGIDPDVMMIKEYAFYKKAVDVIEANLLLSFGTDDNVFDIQSLHRKVSALALPPPDIETIRILKRS